MTPKPTTRTQIRTVTCDHDDCNWRFDGQPGNRLATVRMHARAHGWHCDNPGPGRPALDLCPRHRPDPPIRRTL